MNGRPRVVQNSANGQINEQMQPDTAEPKPSTRIRVYRNFTGAVVPNWLLKRREMSQGAKLCYARLAQFAGKRECAFPKKSTLANELGVSERQVTDYLRELEVVRLIEIEKRGKLNYYFFLQHSWIKYRNSSSAIDPAESPNPSAVNNSANVNRNFSSSEQQNFSSSEQQNSSSDHKRVSRKESGKESHRQRQCFSGKALLVDPEALNKLFTFGEQAYAEYPGMIADGIIRDGVQRFIEWNNHNRTWVNIRDWRGALKKFLEQGLGGHGFPPLKE